MRFRSSLSVTRRGERNRFVWQTDRSVPLEAAQAMSSTPVPEVRSMVEAATRFVRGEIHFSYMVEPIEQCLWWAKVHGVHPTILALATEWQLLADRVWNEYGQHGPGVHLPVEEFRRSVAEDLGIAQNV